MKGLCLALWCSSLFAQETTAQTIDLRGAGEPVSANGIWKWQTGDNPAWAAAEFDDSGWPGISVPGSALPRQSGPLWLRLHVVVTPGATIAFGTAPLAEALELYWNGMRSAGLGTFRGTSLPRFDLLPRPLIAETVGPASGSGVLALRLHRPIGHVHYPIQLGDSSLVAGSPGAVRERVDSRFRFPSVPYYVFVGPEFTSWFSLVLYGTTFLVGLYFLIAWYAAPEVPGFLWFGTNSFLFGLLVILFAHWVSHEVSLTTGNIAISILEGGSIAAWFELHLVLARVRSWWPRVLLYTPGIAGMFREIVFPDRFMPAEGFTYVSMIALPLLGILVVSRNYGQPKGWVLNAGIVPMTLVGTIQMTNFGRHLVGDTFDFPILAIVRENDAAYNTAAAATLVVALGLYLQNSLDAIRREKASLGQELAAGRAMQIVQFPAQSRIYGNWEVQVLYHPAGEVGGDFYWTRTELDGSLLVVTGDVSGKGLRAAMLTSVTVGILRNERSRLPGTILNSVNEGLTGHMGGGFVTCCCARFDATGTVTIANAGHPSPYCDGRELDVEAGLPLGVVAGVDYAEHIVQGDRFTFVSDGVVEAENAKRELFGFDRTREMSLKSAQEIVEAAKGWGQNDDITVMTVRRVAA